MREARHIGEYSNFLHSVDPVVSLLVDEQVDILMAVRSHWPIIMTSSSMIQSALRVDDGESTAWGAFCVPPTIGRYHNIAAPWWHNVFQKSALGHDFAGVYERHMILTSYAARGLIPGKSKQYTETFPRSGF